MSIEDFDLEIKRAAEQALPYHGYEKRKQNNVQGLELQCHLKVNISLKLRISLNLSESIL